MSTAVGYAISFGDIKNFLLKYGDQFPEIKTYLESYTDDITLQMVPIKIGLHYGSKSRGASDSYKPDDYLESWYNRRKNRVVRIKVNELYITKGKKQDVVFALLNAEGESFYGALYNINGKATFVLKKQLTSAKDSFFHTIKQPDGVFLEGIPYIH
jgi:hypothetical protein